MKEKSGVTDNLRRIRSTYAMRRGVGDLDRVIAGQDSVIPFAMIEPGETTLIDGEQIIADLASAREAVDASIAKNKKKEGKLTKETLAPSPLSGGYGDGEGGSPAGQKVVDESKKAYDPGVVSWGHTHGRERQPLPTVTWRNK